jgi:hypothetical protein
MRLAFLAPQIVEAIIAGNQPPELTAEALAKRIDLPLLWTAQAPLGSPASTRLRIASTETSCIDRWSESYSSPETRSAILRV